MSRAKQIDEMAQEIAHCCVDLVESGCLDECCYACLAKKLTAKGYRKQSEGEWDENGRCTHCGWYMPFDCAGNAFESLYCPTCGANMTRKEHKENEKDT